MENRLSNLISALTELTDDLKDVATGDAVQNDGRLELGGFYSPEAEEKKKNEELAASIAEKIDKNAKSRDESEDRDEFTPRKILSKVIPTNIVSFDKTALKQLSSIMPVSCCSVIKEAVEDKKEDTDSEFDFKALGGTILGILTALGVGALIANIEEIKKYIQKWQDFNLKDYIFGDNRTPIENLPVAVKAGQKILKQKNPTKIPVGKEIAKVKPFSDIVKSTAIVDTNKKITTLADDLVRLTTQIDSLNDLPVEDTKTFRTKWNDTTANIKNNFAKISKEVDAVFDATKNRPELAQAARNLQAKTVQFISQNQKLITTSADDIIKTPSLVNDYITKANTTSKNLATQLAKYGDEMAAIDKNIADLRKLGGNVKTVVDGQLIDNIKKDQQTTANRMIKAIDDYTSSVSTGVGKIEANAKAASNVIDLVVTDSNRLFTISDDTLKILQQNQRGAASSITSSIDNISKVYNDIAISADELNKIIDAGDNGPVNRVNSAVDDVARVAKVTEKTMDNPDSKKGKPYWQQKIAEIKRSLERANNGFTKTLTDIGIWTKEFFGPEGPIQKMWTTFKATPAGQAVMNYGGKFLKAAKGILKWVLMPIFAVISIVDAAKDAMKGYEEDGITKAITEGVNSLIDFWVFDTIRVFRDIGTWILGAIGLDRFEKGFDAETDKLMDDILGLFTAMGGVVKGLFTVFTEEGRERLRTELGNVMEQTYQIVSGTVSSLISGVVNVFKDIADIWDKGGDENPYNFKKEVLDPMWENLKNTMSLLTGLVVSEFKSGFDRSKTWVKETIDGAWKQTSKWFKELFDMESHLNNAKQHARKMSKSWGLPDWMTDSLFGKETKTKPTDNRPKTAPVPAAANKLRQTGLVPKTAIDSWTKLPSGEVSSTISKYLKNTGVTLDGKQIKSWQVQTMKPADVDKLVKKLDDVIQSPGTAGKIDKQFDFAAQQLKSMAEEKQRNPRLTPNTTPFPTIPQGESWESGPTLLKYNIKVLENKLKQLDNELDQNNTMKQIEVLRKQLQDANKRSYGASTVLRPSDGQVKQVIAPSIKQVVPDAVTGRYLNLENNFERQNPTPFSTLNLSDEEYDVLGDIAMKNEKLALALKSGVVDMARDENDNLLLKYKNLNKSGEIVSSGAYKFEDNARNVSAMIEEAGSNITSGSKSILEATTPEFPRRESPAAWEYIRDAGKEINAGSKRLYNQAVEFNKQSREMSNPSKSGEDKLAKKVEEMVVILGENSEIQRKTLEALQQHGLIDKQGDTVVNNGGNSTTINNMTVESDIMSFRERVLGRLQPK
jgi:hypothetical protein